MQSNPIQSNPTQPCCPQDYKEFLEEMVKPEDKNATPFITDYKEYHTGGFWGGAGNRHIN